jgi:glycosyltransferase involved in cell wall biosynthesis
MADAALAFAKEGYQVYFITVEPGRTFFSAKGKETLLDLLGKEENAIHIIKKKVGREFEFGTSEYRAFVYEKLLLRVPLGTPVIISDDETIWKAATFLNASYPVIGVLHADDANYYDLAKRYSDNVQAMVCVSQRVNRKTMQLVPTIDPSRLFTIPCGIFLPDIAHHLDAKNELQLVYVGRILHYQKRTGDLIKIADSLAKQKIDFHLQLIGEGSAIPDLEKSIGELGLQDRITFTGWLNKNEIMQLLAGSDIVVLTSDFEGNPIAMMEALASGCGFVGTRVSGIEDYEFHAQAGNCISVFEVGDIADAVRKVQKIAAIPVDIRSRAGRELAEAEFSMKVCLHRYIDVIDTLPLVVTPAGKINFSVVRSLYSKAIALARYIKVSITA